MRIVDSSVAVKWFVSEEGAAQAERLIGKALVAPELLLPEISNVAWVKCRKGEMTADQATLAQGMVTSFVDIVAMRPFAAAALAIALEINHPVYDCFFLAMSEMQDLPLITADARLIRRCAGTRFERLLKPL